MKRRTFARSISIAFGGAILGLPTLRSESLSTTLRPKFLGADPKWARTWDAALAVLASNVKKTPSYESPMLMEGAVYPGVWMKCGPQEALVYASLAKLLAHPIELSPTAVARASHMAFFALQREDGQLPASIKLSGEVGFAQIQMVVPIAATAWDLFQMTHDEELLEAAYKACSKWDAWLLKYRNTRGTGLTEGFCTYDTGHDNSPRWQGVDNRCPDGDAKRFAPGQGVPRLCPDLSATTFGARVALAKMARALGHQHEAARWDESAETIRSLIVEKLYSPEDASFFDLDSSNRFVKVRSDVLSRVMGEHVLRVDNRHEKQIFDDVWTRQLHDPKAFWAPYPLSSIAMDDPAFVRPVPRNSWGGASQALTALRAPRWMEHYGKGTELRVLMRAWVEAIARSGNGTTGEFRQQMDPVTGDFTKADASGYSPAALVYLDFIRRLDRAA